MFPCLDQILHHPARKTWYKGGEAEIKVLTEKVSCVVSRQGDGCAWSGCWCELASCSVPCSALLRRCLSLSLSPTPQSCLPSLTA